MTGRILIADGVPTNRIVLRVKLTSAFYDVQQASSGAEALALIRQERAYSSGSRSARSRESSAISKDV